MSLLYKFQVNFIIIACGTIEHTIFWFGKVRIWSSKYSFSLNIERSL